MSFKKTELGMVPNDWEVVNLEDQLESLIDYRGKTPQKSNDGIVTLSAKSVKMGEIDYSKAYFISEETYQQFMVRGFPQIGDILLTTEAPLGCIAKLDREDVCVAQRLLTLRGKNDVLDNDYLMYYLMSQIGQHQLHSRATGSTVQGIKRSEFKKLSLILPNLKTQQTISKILSDLDHKIKNNRKINETLEGVAQAVFKSWFVDFEPTKTKMAVLEKGGSEEDACQAAMTAISGKSPAELAELRTQSPDNYEELRSTAQLFPSAMTNSELGKIPEGWNVSNFGAVSECFDRLRIPLSKMQREKRQGNIPYHGATSIMDYVDEPIFDGIYLLIGEDGSVLKEDGKPFIQYIWGKSWVNNHAHVLQGKNGISTEHLLTFISKENITAYVTGAVQLKLNQTNMNSIPFIKASNDINDVFKNKIQKMYKCIRNNSEETLTLTQTRDALLPKLLSGEIDVSTITNTESKL